MNTQFFILMKPELIICLIIFLLLFLKVAGSEGSNHKLLNGINVLLIINFAAGFFFNGEGILFNNMYKTNSLIALEKNILNVGVLIISMQSYNWLKYHKHVAEFYMLLL